MKIGILLSGCGVYDGAEIHEAVMTLLALEEEGHEAVCISINKNQHHVVNHLDGTEMNESRNMLVEAARIARGNIKNIADVQPADLDGIVIPGGFGSAKNLTSWAFEGPDGSILPEVKLLLVNLYNIGKPIVGLCVSPVVIAKALEGSGIKLTMTLGTSEEASPYDIPAFHEGLSKTGVAPVQKKITEIQIDREHKIITAPCYMMDANILEIRKNVKQAIVAMSSLA